VYEPEKIRCTISYSFLRNCRCRRRRFLARRKSAREDADIKQAFLQNEETRAASRSGFAEIIADLRAPTEEYQVRDHAEKRARASRGLTLALRDLDTFPDYPSNAQRMGAQEREVIFARDSITEIPSSAILITVTSVTRRFLIDL